MGDFRQDRGKRFGGGRPNFPRKSWGGSGGRDRGPVTMHQAICDQCKKPCEVPFRPTDGKPVYCSVCFEGKREPRDNRGGDRFPRKDFNSYKSYDKTESGNNVGKANNDELKKQLEILNGKMDQLINAVKAISCTKPLPSEEKVKKVIKKVPKKIKK